MQAQLHKKTEIKIYILYVMKNIGYPVSFTKLNDTVTFDGLVSYFNFAECFSELLDTHNIAESKDIDNNDGFIITEQGLNVVDNLLDVLMPAAQRTAIAAAVRLTSFEKRGAKIEATSEKQEDGRFLFKFQVEEKNTTVFSVSLMLESEDQLNVIENNLSGNMNDMYKSILALLSGKTNYLLGK